MKARKSSEPTQWDSPPVHIRTASPGPAASMAAPTAAPKRWLRPSEGKGGTLQFWTIGTMGSRVSGSASISGATNEWSIRGASEKAISKPRSSEPSRTAPRGFLMYGVVAARQSGVADSAGARPDTDDELRHPLEAVDATVIGADDDKARPERAIRLPRPWPERPRRSGRASRSRRIPLGRSSAPSESRQRQPLSASFHPIHRGQERRARSL